MNSLTLPRWFGRRQKTGKKWSEDRFRVKVVLQQPSLTPPLATSPPLDRSTSFSAANLYENVCPPFINANGHPRDLNNPPTGDCGLFRRDGSDLPQTQFGSETKGNHYGTPKPSKDSSSGRSDGVSNGNNSEHNGPGNGVNFPGAHPSSEGKRKRNRSNVEAMTAKHFQEEKEDVGSGNGKCPETPSGSTSTTKSAGSGVHAADSGHPDSPDVPEVSDVVNAVVGDTDPNNSNNNNNNNPNDDGLGPLPANWEKAYTDKGEVYFIDHNTGTSHWLDPRLSRVQKKRPEECREDELPFGWERIDDPHYGTYFIDHVNRRTQYENPVLVAKAANQSADAIMAPSALEASNQYAMGPMGPPPPASGAPGTFPRVKKSQSPFFTRDPSQLRGDRIQTSLVKSAKGLGFTIVGGDDNVEEFLQIKSVVPNGPAWLDGRLSTGDVLVYVNDTCVLGFTHHDMVTMFQSIGSGEVVKLEVCRGYPLPFDPDDPNTEIVTTVAVTSPDQNEWASELERQRVNQSDVQSMPDLSADNRHLATTPSSAINRPGSADLLGNCHPEPDANNMMTVNITKGGMGFGFTIADSAFGQKVKKILDRPRCKTLQEGDVLVEINDRSVRNMSHSDVVKELKECPRGSDAAITIQRGLLPSPASPSKGKFKSKDGGSGSSLLKPKSGFLFRSKTPTAELYATQEREKVPNRPKTPIVDTRNMSSSSMMMRSKTPTNLASPFQRNDMARASLGGAQQPLSDRMSNLGLYDRAKSPGRELEPAYYNGQPQPDALPYANDYGQQPAYGQYDQQYGDYNNYQHQDPRHQQPQQQHYYNNGYNEPGYGYTRGAGQQQGQQPGYSPGYRAGSLPRSVSVNRKESTSFEHSEPLPGGLTRWPHPDPRRSTGQNGMAEPFVEMTVTLQRHDSGFGFRIVGGTEEGSQVSIGNIVPNGAADLDGRLFSGDEIMAVDNTSVVNSSHRQVVGLMGQAAQNGRVTLTVQRRIYQPQDYGPGGRPTEYPYDVTVNRRENEGFGFVIISSASRAGSTIGRIIAGSPAERCGRLHIGDRILAVNRVDIANLHHGDIVNLIKDSGYSVVLTVGPPVDDASSNASNSHRSSTSSMVTAQALPTLVPPSAGSLASSTSNPAESPTRSAPVGFPSTWAGPNPVYNNFSSSNVRDYLRDDPNATPTNEPHRQHGQFQEDHELNMLDMDDQYYAVELGRGSRGFGFSIRGGREFHSMPLFVLRIAVDGPAAADGRLRVGDQIVEINGVNTKNMTHAEAIDLIKSGGTMVRLLVRRGKVPPVAIMDTMGMSPLSPTPQPASGAVRPMSAMSQPVTSTGYGLPPGAIPLPGITSSGDANGVMAANSYNNYAGQPQPANGHLNGPVSHSSPRVVASADSYYWNHY